MPPKQVLTFAAKGDAETAKGDAITAVLVVFFIFFPDFFELLLVIKSGGGCMKRYPLSGGCSGLWVVRDDREVARGSETVYLVLLDGRSLCEWLLWFFHGGYLVCCI